MTTTIIDNLLNEIPDRTNNSYISVLFNLACLYATVTFLFSMLALNSTPFQERQSNIKKLWAGHHTQQIEMFKKNQKDNKEKNRLERMLDFTYHFFMRPSVLTGLIFAVMIIRNHAQPIVSMVLAYSLAAIILAKIRSYETKFIPSMLIGLSIAYGALHYVGYTNGWHLQVGI